MRKNLDRKKRLENKINEVLKTDGLNTEDILTAVSEFEKDNLDTITKLKKVKHLETKRISGALRQTINSHGPITKVLIGSATKRIHGSLLANHKQEEVKKEKKFSIKSILLGLAIGVILGIIIF